MASFIAPNALGINNKIVQTITGHAEANPQQVALRSGNRDLSYGELHTRSSAIAKMMKNMGAGPDALVAILAERGPVLAAAILGALKAGSGYLPIDAETPPDRAAFMLRDSAPCILVTQDRFRALAERAGATINVLYLEDTWFDEELPDQEFPSDNVAVEISEAEPSSLAYVIYTSGSTGSPKGVEITREGLRRFCAHMQEELRFRPGDRALALASVSFDVAIFELLFPLYCGGEVVILPRSTAADGRKLAEAITRYRPSVLLATPATWQILIDSGWEGDPSLRAVSGGEVMQTALADQIRGRAGELWNHYGPTESTIATTTYRVRGGEKKIPVGRGIAGLHLFVLDSHGNPVNEGEAGELFISGPGVARGYRGDPARTAERFIHLSQTLGEVRAYRTGDMVRVNSDGDYEFVGRADNQVKIRGHRVELEEIEAALMRYPGVTEAAVIVHDVGAHDLRLVAFVSLVKGAKKDATALRKFVGMLLYKFMIPGKIFFLPVLPKTLNRKIDRRALEQMAGSGFDIKKSLPAEVRDQTEADLLEIWRRLPGFESVGTEDSFFDYGGHSLLAVHMIREAEEKFGVTLPLATLFEAPTVKDLARIVKQGGEKSRPWSPLVPIRAAGTRPPLFCVHGIGGNVLNFERLGVWLDSEQPLYGLQAAGIDHGKPLTDVEEMARLYLDAIRQVQPTGPYLLAGYSAGGIVAFEMARQLRAAGDEVGMLILFDALMYSNTLATKGPLLTGYLRKIKGPLARLGLFLRMRGEDRREAMWRNWSYYWWLLGIKLRVRAFLLLNRLGIEWAPGNMQDAFALAIHKYQVKSFDGRVLLYRAAHGDHSSSSGAPTMGWENVVGQLSVEVCQADHLGMFYEPQVRLLAQSLNRHLRDAVLNSYQTAG